MQKVVLVEDNPMDSTIISAKFEGSDLSINVVTKLEDLRSQFSATEIDLLLLDLNLPTTSGIRSLSWAKEICPQVPIVVVTAFLSPDIRKTILATGAADVLDKADLDSVDLVQLARSTINPAR